MAGPGPSYDRRHPHLSPEELRRQLTAADEDRYRLRQELARRRVRAGAAGLLVAGIGAGLLWQMCTPTVKALDRQPAVAGESTIVTPTIVPAAGEPAAPRRPAVGRGVRPAAAKT